MTPLDRRRQKRTSSNSDENISISKKKRERNLEDVGKYSSPPNSPRLKENFFETGGPHVGPKTEAIIEGCSTGSKRKVVSVTIALHTTRRKAKVKIDSDDLGEEPGSTLSSKEYSYLVSERRRKDEKLKGEKVKGKSKQVKAIQKKPKRGVIESDSGSNSDDSSIHNKPWMRSIKKSSPITYKKEEKESAQRNVGSSIRRYGSDRKDSQASTPPLLIPKKKKLPALDGADEKKKRKKMSNSQSNPESLPLSNGEDEMGTKASTVPLNIPKRKKMSIGQSDQKLQLSSSALKTVITRKEPTQETKSDSLIANMANVSKIEKSSPSKFPSKPALKASDTVRAVDNPTQPNWKSGGGGLGDKEGSASRSKMNAQQQQQQQQQQQSTWISQQQRQQLPGNGSPSKKPIQPSDSVTESILNDLNKIIQKVLFYQEKKDSGLGKIEKLETLGVETNNSKEVGSNSKYIEKENSYDYFDRNDDGTIIIDPPRNPTSCDDSRVGRKDLPLSWWGIKPPPDNIVSMHNNNVHPLAENKVRKIVSGNNTGEIFPGSHGPGQGWGNGPPFNSTQGYWGGREWEGQRFVDGGRNNWRNNGTRRDWGNGRGRGSGGGAGHDGSGWGRIPDDRHLNAPSFDRSPTRRPMR